MSRVNNLRSRKYIKRIKIQQFQMQNKQFKNKTNWKQSVMHALCLSGSAIAAERSQGPEFGGDYTPKNIMGD